MTVPLVVVTGFLGAGKTTLVNRLLARRRARNATGKIGVIVNELGAVGIDGALLGGETARQIELPGGCVCCVLGDELETTLRELVAQNPTLEAIVLETTGVAEPLPIAWAVAREPVCREVRLAAVVTLVDVTNFLPSRAISASVDAQVAYADVLLMTKAELDPDAHGAIAAVLDELAPRALRRLGSVDDHAGWLETLLADPVLARAEDFGDPRDVAPGSHVMAYLHEHPQPNGEVTAHVHTADCRHLDSSAAHGIDSVWHRVESVVDLEELADQLAELPPNYVRIKGIVQARGRDDALAWFAIHRVGPRVSSEPIAVGEPQDAQQARIVALGPGVETLPLARCILAAAV